MPNIWTSADSIPAPTATSFSADEAGATPDVEPEFDHFDPPTAAQKKMRPQELLQLGHRHSLPPRRRMNRRRVLCSTRLSVRGRIRPSAPRSNRGKSASELGEGDALLELVEPLTIVDGSGQRLLETRTVHLLGRQPRNNEAIEVYGRIEVVADRAVLIGVSVLSDREPRFIGSAFLCAPNRYFRCVNLWINQQNRAVVFTPNGAGRVHLGVLDPRSSGVPEFMGFSDALAATWRTAPRISHNVHGLQALPCDSALFDRPPTLHYEAFWTDPKTDTLFWQQQTTAEAPLVLRILERYPKDLPMRRPRHPEVPTLPAISSLDATAATA